MGVDYVNCQTPVFRTGAFNAVCCIAAEHPSWAMRHSDQKGGFMHFDNDPVLARMPKGLREYKIVGGVRREVYYWVRNLYGRHDAGHIYIKGHRQWFKDQGWTTAGMGKIFHPNSPPQNDPISWSLPYYDPKNGGE